MTDKTPTPPYETTFDEIRPGQTIEREWRDGDRRFRLEAVAGKCVDADQVWLTADGYHLCGRNPDETLRVLAEPPKPALPTEPGTVIAGMHENRPFVAVTWHPDGSARGAYTDGKRDTFANLRPSDDFDWTVVPTAPKTDGGLRERVEALATEWQNDFGQAPSFARKLRDVLAVVTA